MLQNKFRFLLFVLALFCATGAQASVVLVGTFPGKALLVIDGGAPKTLAVGESSKGVKLLVVEDAAVMLDIDGKKVRVAIGHPVSIGGNGGAGQMAVLSADGHGAFSTDGAINGVPVNFVVDTGASLVSMSQSTARKVGINYMAGRQGRFKTANGEVTAWIVQIKEVTVKGITLRDIEGVVMPSEIPQVLLGMSFLSRVEMHREGSSMTLRRRY